MSSETAKLHYTIGKLNHIIGSAIEKDNKHEMWAILSEGISVLKNYEKDFLCSTSTRPSKISQKD